jgi:hypothetical protein
MKRALPVGFLLASAFSAVGCEPTPPEDYGEVYILLARSPQEMTSPFDGTVFIRVFLDYGECLQNFYFNAHTEHQFAGVEGAKVREEWLGQLCAKGGKEKSIISCDVVAPDDDDPMYQTLDDSGQVPEARLHVIYQVTDDNLEGYHIPFGPLPTEHLAECAPVVTLSQGSVQGQDANSAQVWRIASFEDNEAEVGQGAAIQIFAERPN